MLRRALGELEIAGVTTNRALLASVLGDAEFSPRAGGNRFSRAAARAHRLRRAVPDAEDYLLAALWCATSRADPGGTLVGYHGMASRRCRPSRAGDCGDVTVSLERTAPSAYRGRVADRDYALQLVARADPAFEVDIDGRVHRLNVVESGQDLHLFRGGALRDAARGEHRGHAASHGRRRMRARWSRRCRARSLPCTSVPASAWSAERRCSPSKR